MMTDPVADMLHLRFVEPIVLLRRHGGPVVFMLSRDGEVERTFERLSGDHRRLLAFAASEQARPRAQIEIPLQLAGLFAMAGEASRFEQGQHLAREDHLG